VVGLCSSVAIAAMDCVVGAEAEALSRNSAAAAKKRSQITQTNKRFLQLRVTTTTTTTTTTATTTTTRKSQITELSSPTATEDLTSQALSLFEVHLRKQPQNWASWASSSVIHMGWKYWTQLCY
jgi:hypothetical protein